MAIAPEDGIREVIATPKRTAKPKATPKSSVPTMPPAMTPQTKPTPKPAPSTQTGPLGGLSAGVVAGVNPPNTVVQENSTTSNIDDDKESILPQDQTDKDTQETVDGDKFNVEEYTKSYLDKITEAEKTAERRSAFNILKMEFQQYGLGSLVDKISNLLTDGTPSAEFALRLRDTDEYKARFKANEIRISKGLAALSPAEYVALEDQYQNVMRNYDLPESYYSKDETGKQIGFEQLLANDVSATELEERVITAQDRVLKANPEVSKALKQFYPGITNGDILAYALDPKNALKDIQRKVTAAEIGGAAIAQGLSTAASRAEELAGYGVTKQQAQQGYEAVAGVAPRGGQLAAMYKQDPYTQQTAETEVFGLAGSAEAKKKREKLTALETASFSGQAGRGVLARERAGSI